MNFRHGNWADIVEVFRAGNPKKHHSAVELFCLPVGCWLKGIW